MISQVPSCSEKCPQNSFLDYSFPLDFSTWMSAITSNSTCLTEHITWPQTSTFLFLLKRTFILLITLTWNLARYHFKATSYLISHQALSTFFHNVVFLPLIPFSFTILTLTATFLHAIYWSLPSPIYRHRFFLKLYVLHIPLPHLPNITAPNLLNLKSKAQIAHNYLFNFSFPWHSSWTFHSYNGATLNAVFCYVHIIPLAMNILSHPCFLSSPCLLKYISFKAQLACLLACLHVFCFSISNYTSPWCLSSMTDHWLSIYLWWILTAYLYRLLVGFSKGSYIV